MNYISLVFTLIFIVRIVYYIYYKVEHLTFLYITIALFCEKLNEKMEIEKG